MDNVGAELMGVRKLPIPTEQRLDVFVSGWLSGEAMSRWSSQAGTSQFHFADALDLSPTCGICLFELDRHGLVPRGVWKQVEPYFRRAGGEANVFQWQPLEQNFVRRDEAWVRLRVPSF